MLVAGAFLAAACSESDPALAPSTTVDFAEVAVTTEAPAIPLTLPPAEEPRERRGVVRVGMWMEPDPFAEHLGGDIVRGLTQPQLFTPRPGGGWAPRLVEPGSVVEADDLTSVSFRLREGARWSDGTAIDGGDLRRTLDDRFVASVEESTDGVVTVRFLQPLPGWRRLWSGTRSIRPPADSHLDGGPFRVTEVVAGLETVLEPNDSWWGVDAGEGPWIDELRLVVVPDQTTLLQLLERGKLDVAAPWAVPGLREWLCEPVSVEDSAAAEAGGDGPPCEFDVDVGGGWQATVFLHPDRVALDARRSLLTGFAPDDFVATLLRGEAVAAPFEGFEPRPVADLRSAVTIALAEDIPMLGTAARAVQLQVDDGGGVVPELQLGPSRLVAEWAIDRDYDVLVAEAYLGPSPCWVCLYGAVLPGEAGLAEAGDTGPLFSRLASDALARPLWTSDRYAAWRPGIEGVEANAWSLFVTWNAWQWTVSG